MVGHNSSLAHGCGAAPFCSSWCSVGKLTLAAHTNALFVFISALSARPRQLCLQCTLCRSFKLCLSCEKLISNCNVDEKIRLLIRFQSRVKKGQRQFLRWLVIRPKTNILERLSVWENSKYIIFVCFYYQGLFKIV